MLDRIRDYAPCLTEPHRWAIATVAEVSGSVPRPAGTSMAVRDDMLTIGSVSGGCVEAAVVHAAVECIATGRATIADFGYSDGAAFAVGLMCGGDLRVLVQPFEQVADAGRTLLAGGDPGHALVRLLPGSQPTNQVARQALSLLPVVLPASGDVPIELSRALGIDAGVLTALACRGGVTVLDVLDREVPGCPSIGRLLVESRCAPARLVIYGANDYSAALAQMAALVGRRVTVCDARGVFATAARHPGAHEVIVRHPKLHLREELDGGRLDRSSAVVVLTHDPRFDLPVLEQALRADVGYVGAMGSRRTHERRVQELRHGGLPVHCLDRLHSPIGLDIGARTPHEVAVAILAEIIAAGQGKNSSQGITGLHRTAGPVHAAHRAGLAGVH